MKESILFVDDEPNVLAGYERQMRSHFNVHTALGGNEGLARLENSNSFAVVVSDMRMPGMDGIQFLRKVRSLAPDTVRMMLTGHADTATAMNAVNEGNIFRFMTKPCTPEELARAIFACIDQWRLIRAEKELLEKTLQGSVRVLIELLELLNPAAFGRANRLRTLVRTIGQALELTNLWQFDLAALLSQIGCVTVPPNVLEMYFAHQKLAPHEQAMLDGHPQVGKELLSNIPRLEPIADMIAMQNKRFDEYDPATQEGRQKRIDYGAQLLKATLDFDWHISSGVRPAAAIAAMRGNAGHYNLDMLECLNQYKMPGDQPHTIRTITVRDLTVDVEADEDILTTNGLLLVAKGRRVTYPLLLRIRNFAAGAGVREPFRVRET